MDKKKEKITISFDDFGSMYFMRISTKRAPEKDILFVNPSAYQIRQLFRKYDYEISKADLDFYLRLEAANA